LLSFVQGVKENTINYVNTYNPLLNQTFNNIILSGHAIIWGNHDEVAFEVYIIEPVDVYNGAHVI